MVFSSVSMSGDQVRPLRSVSSVAFAVGGGRAFERTIEIAVGWMQRLNPAIPPEAVHGSAIDIGGGGLHSARAVALSIDESRVWSATIDNPDRQVPGRTWVTEITVAEKAGEVHIGTRLLNVARWDVEPFVPSIPRVVRDVIQQLPCATDGESLADEPRYVASDEDLDQLVTLLELPRRRLPVVVLAEGSNRPEATNLPTLAKRLAGAAHVFGITRRQAARLTRRVGQQLSVFDGGVRLYRPGLSFEDADPFDHLLWLSGSGRSGAGVRDRIVARVLSAGVSKGTTDYPRFEAVSQAATQQALAARRVDASNAEIQQSYESEISILRTQLEELRIEQNRWLADAESERSAAEREISELKAGSHRYRVQIESLRTAIRAPGTATQRQTLTDYLTFSEWAEVNLTPNVWLAPKAVKEVERNGQYRNPREIGEALTLLDEIYAPMRRNPTPELHAAWEAGLKQLGLTAAPCFTREGDLQRFPEYRVSYHDERCWCDQHLKSGGGADPKSMFRVYYHWHPADGVVLIGHLPGHLDNNLTN